MADLAVDRVTKNYSTRAEPLVVLRGCTFSLARGQNLAVLGPSGSGKSTLLQIIGTLDEPSSGTVRILGQDPFALSEAKLAAFRNANVGFVFQDHHLLPQCSVLENVLLPALALGPAQTEHVDRAREILDRVGLSARLDHRPSELSGGERQRVAIARALLMRPALVLADEPTGNLDRTTAGSVADLLLELQQQEQTMLIAVTHSLDLASRFQKQLELDAGELRGTTSAGAALSR